jgi:hypothetical protein
VEAFEMSFVDAKAEKMRLRNVHILQCSTTIIVAVFLLLFIILLFCDKYYLAESRPCRGLGG